MITRSLKFTLSFATLAAIQGMAPLGAAVTLISVEHRVWGDAGRALPSTYDETAFVPLSRDISSNDPVGGSYYASSAASEWSVNAYRAGGADFCNGYARNTYLFTPLNQQLSISLVGRIGVWWFENDALMTLTDLNTNSVVSSYQSPSYFQPQSPFSPGDDDMVDYNIDWHTTLAVDPLHEYELMLLVGAHRGEGGSGSASLNLTLAPEPGTVLLAGVAVLITCGRRQRQIWGGKG